jgi:hypothetical protein
MGAVCRRGGGDASFASEALPGRKKSACSRWGDAEGRENLAMTQPLRFILREERTFNVMQEAPP